jgi:hypothetical protein
MSRVKMFGAIPRAPHISPQHFHDHYRHPHGTLGRHITKMRGYVQSHQVHSDLLDDRQTRFEACAEVWIDSVADAAIFGEDPVYLSDVKDDEPNFVDLPNLRWLFVDEEVLMSGPDMGKDTSLGDQRWRLDNRPNSFKLIQFVEVQGAEPWDQDNDRDLGKKIGALRHVRSRPVSALHPDGGFAIGIRELWWGSQTGMETGIAADPRAWHELFSRPAVATSFFATAERFI